MTALRLRWIAIGSVAVAIALAGAAVRPPPARAQAIPLPPAAADQAVAAKDAQLLHDPLSPVIGNPAGDVAIIEFFDYNCPYCKATEPRLEALLHSDRKLKLVLKEFPILTPQSMVATKVALAAAKQGKYEAFHNAMMNSRGALTETLIFDTAKSVGLNMARLRKDMASTEILNEIIANMNLARSLRIFQTPGYIVDDHILTGQSADFDFPKQVAAARAAGPVLK